MVTLTLPQNPILTNVIEVLWEVWVILSPWHAQTWFSHIVSWANTYNSLDSHTWRQLNMLYVTYERLGTETSPTPATVVVWTKYGLVTQTPVDLTPAGGPISWKSCRQDDVSLWTFEAGFVAASQAAQEVVYRDIPGNRNWQIETADWNLDVRLDIWVKKLYARLEILLRNSLTGSKTVVSISRDDPVSTQNTPRFWILGI